jgi:hypothetical protein
MSPGARVPSGSTTRMVYTTKSLTPSLPSVGVVSLADDTVIWCSFTLST